ncbi:MAG: hypothetical protein M1820_003912 [Bogoriella megaspora]|nr:MAG: hypothetical protein M1820_003912 [Bogoriella megaspora]
MSVELGTEEDVVVMLELNEVVTASDIVLLKAGPGEHACLGYNLEPSRFAGHPVAVGIGLDIVATRGSDSLDNPGPKPMDVDITGNVVGLGFREVVEKLDEVLELLRNPGLFGTVVVENAVVKLVIDVVVVVRIDRCNLVEELDEELDEDIGIDVELPSSFL